MLTIPTNLQKYIDRDFIATDFLLKITGATTTFRLSGMSRTITESGTDYLYRGLVKSWGTIKHRIDLLKAKLNIGNMVITLINIPYKADSPSRLSEEFTATEISYREAAIYLWADGISDISDCLQIYKGVIRPIQKISGASFDIELVDATETEHKLLPESLIDLSDYTNPPAESENKPIPLAYGDFNPTKDYNAIKYGKLIEGVWIEPDKLVFSDHQLKTVDAVWILDEDIGELVKLDSGDHTANLDDSGRTTIKIDNVVDALMTAWIYPDKADVEHIDDPDYIFLDEEKGLTLDMDGNTYVEATVDSYSPNGNQDDEHEDSIFGRFKSVSPIGDHQNVYLNLRFDANFNTLLHHGNDFTFWIDSSSTEVGHLPVTPGSSSLPNYNETDITSFFNTNSLTLQDIVAPNGLRIQVIGRKRVSDGTRKKIGEYYDMRLRVTYKRSIETSMRIFVEGEGRKYGSWIDEGGRSNSYNSGDLISNPAFIVESFLRDELGFASAEIDDDSFDIVGEDLSTNWPIVIFLDKQINSKKIIEQVCRETGLGFFLTAGGKGKIFRVPDITKADDFDLDHIKKETLSYSMGDERFLVNDVDINYMKSNHLDDEFHLVSVGINSASQTKHNITRREPINAEFIESTSVADRLRDQYIGPVLAGDNGIGGTADSKAAETKIGCKFTAAESRRLFWIAAYLGSSGYAREFYAAIYADSSGAPAARLATTTIRVFGPSSTDGPAWVFFAFDGLDLISGTDYWLVIKGVGGGWKFYYDSGTTNQAATNADPGYGDPPDNPFGTPIYSNRSYSIYTSVGFWHDLRPMMEIDMILWKKIAWELGDSVIPGDDLNNYIELFDERFSQARFKVIEKRLSLLKGISYKLMRVN